MSQEIEETNKILNRTNTNSGIELDLIHKIVTVRKWKAKDRKLFRKMLDTEKEMDTAIIDALVKNCILKSVIKNTDKPAVLTYNEYQYIFIKLRELSIAKDFDFTYKCECGTINKLKVPVSDVNKIKCTDWGTITVNDNIFEFQEAPNVDFYYKNKTDEEINEMAFFTKLINNDETKSFNDVIDFYEDMDISEFDELLTEYRKMEFNVDNTKTFTCSKCKEKTKFEFDEIPGFFPDTWIN